MIIKKKHLLNIFYTIFFLAGIICVILFLLARKPVPEKIGYGMSFNTPYARELGLDWQETYDAILDDLQVRKLRLAGHWPMVEPVPGQYSFTELDYQIKRAEEVGAEVIFAVGRRLPRWPECHVPGWARSLSKEDANEAQMRFMTEVVNRYKDSPAIKMWQVENEPFLALFASEQCGEIDEAFFQKEIELVRSLDPTREILVTDSGNLGTWHQAYRYGDWFGTSVYVYFWNPELGQFRTLLPAWFYRAKEKVLTLWYGPQPTVLIELSAEPWLLEPITDVPVDIQFGRMDLEKFESILEYAKDTRYDQQYLWGAEWWYWLSKQGYPEMWQKGQELFRKDIVQ